VRFNYLDKKQKASPDYTLGSRYYSFIVDLKPSLIARGTIYLLMSSVAPILTYATMFLQSFISIYSIYSISDSLIIDSFWLGKNFKDFEAKR